MRSLGGVYMYVNKSGLPHELIDLVYLRVSQINGCAFCVAAHSRDLLKAGVPPVKRMMLNAWREADMVFSARERAALLWAESLTRVSETGAPQADYDVMSEYFTERERVDLTLAVGLINTYNRLAIGFRKTPDVAMPG